MNKIINLVLLPEQVAKKDLLLKEISTHLSIEVDRINHYNILRKSIDARSRKPKINISISVFWDGEIPTNIVARQEYKDVSNAESVIVVGAGPAGLFAALQLIKSGLKPILLERGKSVQQRLKDISAINRNENFNEESNFCFGEGGAGTFSDGKLYTRSKKKGDVREVLEIFHQHGAKDDILYEAHPHIGSDILPIVVQNIRNTILRYGGEYYFEKCVNNFLIENGKIEGCKTSDGSEYRAKALLLATGHSARDVYELLAKQNISLEAKGFAIGVRVEHSQELIDKIQYHCEERGDYLPAATYSLVEQVDGRGVYSFCMCPGGQIVPAGSSKDEIVVNGMSASKRNSPYSNSGIVVEIHPEDLPQEFLQYGSLAGLRFQEYIEQLAQRNNGGKGFLAPAQRLHDFVNGKLSADLPKCSYVPGLISSPLHFWLPDFISKRLQKGFKLFDRKMRGYLTNDAVIVGVESRSSSPVRIPRDKEKFCHTEILGLFPAGEGSGYSGGITSSAIDGINSALKIAEYLN